MKANMNELHEYGLGLKRAFCLIFVYVQVGMVNLNMVNSKFHLISCLNA